MADIKTREFVDQVVAGENIEAGETFKDLMQDKNLKEKQY